MTLDEKSLLKYGLVSAAFAGRRATAAIECYDPFVLGSGSAGQRAAIEAVKLGKRAALLS